MAFEWFMQQISRLAFARSIVAFCRTHHVYATSLWQEGICTTLGRKRLLGHLSVEKDDMDRWDLWLLLLACFK